MTFLTGNNYIPENSLHILLLCSRGVYHIPGIYVGTNNSNPEGAREMSVKVTVQAFLEQPTLLALFSFEQEP